MGLDLLAADVRAAVMAGQRIDQDLVLGYWTDVLDTDPDVLHARVDRIMTSVTVPVLAIRPPTRAFRLRTAHTPSRRRVRSLGRPRHFAHLAVPDRFAERLRAFFDRCADAPTDAPTPQAYLR